MTYKRTVYCRHCGNPGHNQRTCLELRKKAAENPNSYAAQKVAVHDSLGKNRVCSYCQKNGHNIATCQKLDDDRFGAVVKNSDFRKKTLEKFKELGIGLGTMFHLVDRWKPENDILLIVDEIKWDEIIYDNADPAIMVMKDGERSDFHAFKVNDYFYKMMNEGRIKIVHATDLEHIGVGIPDDWEKGLTNIKKAFPRWE